VDGEILHQLKKVVNIPLIIGFQPSFWWFIGFRWPIHCIWLVEEKNTLCLGEKHGKSLFGGIQNVVDPQIIPKSSPFLWLLQTIPKW
jgi:hypothetical protein